MAPAYSLAAVRHSKYSHGKHGHGKHGHSKHARTASQWCVDLPPLRRLHPAAASLNNKHLRVAALPAPPAPSVLPVQPAPSPSLLGAYGGRCQLHGGRVCSLLYCPLFTTPTGASCTVGEYVRSFRHKLEREQNKQRSGPGAEPPRLAAAARARLMVAVVHVQSSEKRVDGGRATEPRTGEGADA